MQKANPDKQFIPAPPDDTQLSCNECEYMKMITLENIYKTLSAESPEVTVDEQIREAALRPVQRMLEISSKLGI